MRSIFILSVFHTTVFFQLTLSFWKIDNERITFLESCAVLKNSEGMMTFSRKGREDFKNKKKLSATAIKKGIFSICIVIFP